MNSYVITFNEKESILADYKTIEGKTPKEALEKEFGKTFVRLYGEDGRYASIILVKGKFENNTIKYSGSRYQQLCFEEV